MIMIGVRACSFARVLEAQDLLLQCRESEDVLHGREQAREALVREIANSGRWELEDL